MNVVMALFDLIPVVAYLVGSIIFQRCLYNKMSKGAFAVYASGTMFVFMAGAYKAIQKMLFYTNVCDFVPLRESFFPMQTTGFVLTAAGLLAMVVHPQGKNKAYSFIPVVSLLLILADVQEWNGTMLFVVFMILGVLISDACFIFVSIKNKCYITIILFAISFVFILGMGYLSTKSAEYDWIKEIVNCVGQGSYLAAALILRKKGLAKEDFAVGLK